MTPARTVQPEPYWLVTAGLVAADQLSKLLASRLDGTVDLGPLTLGKVVNREGAFGLDIPNDVLIVLGLVSSAVLLLLLLATSARPPARLGMWLLLGGIVGNLIDRITAGGAVDIISISGFNHFNLADVLIVLGGLSLIRSLWWRNNL